MHEEFKKLLENATGVSEQVIAINLDIRDFSAFCKENQDWDVANFIKVVYLKILDEYFPIASFYKATGDGLIVIIRCEPSDVKEKVNYVVKSCLRLVKNFSTLCEDQEIINFTTPSKIGIGIARGSICCISNLQEKKILDYSGRILNLASRLMDMARPTGIVIDKSLGLNLLEENYMDLFTEAKVYVRGISEKKGILVYHTKKETTIPEEYKKPRKEKQWKTNKLEETYKRIKNTKVKNFSITLKPKPSDDEEVYWEITFTDKTTKASITKLYSSKDDLKIIHRGKKHYSILDSKILIEYLGQFDLADDSKLVIEYCYPID